MPTITIDVPKTRELDVLKILAGIEYIKIKDRKKIKEHFKKKLVNSLKEIELMENGKLEKVPIDQFLKELRNGK